MTFDMFRKQCLYVIRMHIHLLITTSQAQLVESFRCSQHVHVISLGQWGLCVVVIYELRSKIILKPSTVVLNTLDATGV